MRFVLYLCYFANDQAEPERLSLAEPVDAPSLVAACEAVDDEWNEWLARTHSSWVATRKAPNGFILCDQVGKEVARRPIGRAGERQ